MRPDCEGDGLPDTRYGLLERHDELEKIAFLKRVMQESCPLYREEEE